MSRVRKPPAIEGAAAEEIIEGEALTEGQYDLIRERSVPVRQKASVELTKAVGAEGELSGLDARLLKLAASGRSLEEISEEVGGSLSPARAGQRIREILSSRDWLSESERELILMNEMLELKDRLKNLVEKWDEADYLHGLDPRMIGMLQKMLTDLSKAVEQRRKAAQTERVSIRATHAKLIVTAIESTFRLFLHDLSKEYTEVDERVARDMLESALPRAIASIEAQTEQV